MTALAFDFHYDDDVEPAPKPGRRLYAVRGTVEALDTAPAGAPPQPPGDILVAAPAPEAPRLDVLLGGAWSAVSADALISCPVCTTGTMVPRPSAGAGIAGGRCADCGSTLE